MRAAATRVTVSFGRARAAGGGVGRCRRPPADGIGRVAGAATSRGVVSPVRVGGPAPPGRAQRAGRHRADGGRRARLHRAARRGAGGPPRRRWTRQGQWPGDRVLRRPGPLPLPTMSWPPRSSSPAPPPSRPPATPPWSVTTSASRRSRSSPATDEVAAEALGAGARPTPSPARCPATSAGTGRSPSPASPATTRSPSTRSCCCPATPRCWRRRGCRGTSGCAPATSRSATCCPPPRTTRGWCRPTRPTTTPPTTPRAASSPRSSGSAASGSCRARAAREAVGRWAAGEFGPASPMARQAPGPCVTCGFFLPLAGSLRAVARRLRQRLRPGRRPRRHRRLRLRRAQPGDARGRRGRPRS